MHSNLPTIPEQSERLARYDRCQYASWLAVTSPDPFIREVMATLPTSQRVVSASIVPGFRADDPPYVHVTLAQVSWASPVWPDFTGFDVREGGGCDAVVREAKNGSVLRMYQREFRVFRTA